MDTNPQKNRRVLVVDDNEFSAKTMGWTLELMGYDFALAHNAKQALDTVISYKPHIILLDIGLPDMNGYELCRKLRQLPETRDAAIIAQTGWGMDEHRKQSYEAGFDNYLVKPVDMYLLQDVLESLEKKKSAA